MTAPIDTDKRKMLSALRAAFPYVAHAAHTLPTLRERREAKAVLADIKTALGGKHDIDMPLNLAIAYERERCAEIAEAVNSGRGNEQIIADAIRRRGDEIAP